MALPNQPRPHPRLYRLELASVRHSPRRVSDAQRGHAPARLSSSPIGAPSGGRPASLSPELGLIDCCSTQERFGFMPRFALLVALCALTTTAIAAEPPSVQSTAAQLLEKDQPAEDRSRLIDENADRAGDLIAEMAKGLGDDAKEEYRRIPFIWRVAVAAGKRNDTTQLRRVIEVSLPGKEGKLRDWQAVVIGGGVINGITLAGKWPGPRIAEIVGDDAAL